MASQCPGSGDSLQGGVPHSQESHNELFDSHQGKFDHTYSMSTEVQDEVPQCQLRNNEVLQGQTTSDLDKALSSKSLDNPNDADDLTNHVSAAHTHTATALTSDSRHVESISVHIFIHRDAVMWQTITDTRETITDTREAITDTKETDVVSAMKRTTSKSTKLCSVLPLGIRMLNAETNTACTTPLHVSSRYQQHKNTKVYDRLNKVGVSISYAVMQRDVAMTIAKDSHILLVEAVKAGKYIKFIGDNLNFMQDVRDERSDRHQNMVHIFASAALIYDHHFLPWDLPPQIPLQHLSMQDISLTKAEYDMIFNDMVRMLVDLMVLYFPQLRHFKRVIPKSTADPQIRKQCIKTQVVGLETWALNEHYYQDDVKILENLQTYVGQMYREAGKGLTDDIHVPLGGDQLNRERFSIAKLMRLGNNTGVDQFVNLSPVVFEFMHLSMNFLDKLPLTLLWHKDGDRDLGTMKSAAERISRNNVEPGASKAYTANKEFFVSYTNAYIIEGLRDFFGMKELNDVPSKNGPPLDLSETDKWTWLQSTIKTFIDRYAFPHWSGSAMNNDVEIGHVDVGPFMTVILSNGTQLRIPDTPHREPIIGPTKPDEVKNYAHLSLELGIVFKYFLQLYHTPNREKFLALMKMMLVMMKARNPKAKYPLEILRLLVQQYSLLPEKEARQVFFASFVNTRGRPDSFIPADLQMEWLVRENKRHIKHMFANKTKVNCQE